LLAWCSPQQGFQICTTINGGSPEFVTEYVENQDTILINVTATTATIICVTELAVLIAKLIACNMAWSSLWMLLKLYPVSSGGLVCRHPQAEKD